MAGWLSRKWHERGTQGLPEPQGGVHIFKTSEGWDRRAVQVFCKRAVAAGWDAELDEFDYGGGERELVVTLNRPWAHGTLDYE